jgi:hypothetical protein
LRSPMPSQHRTPLVGWHTKSPQTMAWVRKQAARQQRPLSDLLDEAIALLYEKYEGTGEKLAGNYRIPPPRSKGT